MDGPTVFLRVTASDPARAHGVRVVERRELGIRAGRQ